MLSLLFTVASAHMYMSSPEPRFEEASRFDKPAPASICNLVPYKAGSGQEVIPAFNQGLKAAGFKNLRDYADACARATSKKICGNTIPSASVPFPSSNNVQIDIGADHIGPSEIWVDDRLVMYNAGINGYSIMKTPRSTFVDFAKECPSGDCQVRFVMIALHLSPAEVFDNCVRVRGTATSSYVGATTARSAPDNFAATASVRNAVQNFVYENPKVVINSRVAEPTIQPGYTRDVVAANPKLEWTCKGKDLVRNVNGKAYKYVCPEKTECQTEGLPYAMCDWSKAVKEVASNPKLEWTCKGKDLVRNVNGKAYKYVCPEKTECQTEGLPYAMCNWST